MTTYQKDMPLRWADFDANFHLRHSVYYDLGASLRVQFLQDCGLSMAVMQEHHLGFVLLREEAVFRRELRMGDAVTINLRISKLRRDYSRFSFRHEILKQDGTLAATLNIDGAWIDTKIRKLAVPPAFIADMIKFTAFTEDFEWE